MNTLHGLNEKQIEAVTHKDGAPARHRRSRYGQNKSYHAPH